MKKILSMILAVAMIAGLVACGTTTPPASSTTKPAASSTTQPAASSTTKPAASSTPEVKEPIKLTVGIPASTAVAEWEENDLTKLVESKGFDLDFTLFATKSDEYKTQLAAMVAANEKLPDVLINFSLGTELRDMYGKDGYFVDLNQFYKDEEFMSQFEWWQIMTGGGVDKDILDRFWIEGLSADGSWWAGLSEVGAKSIDTNSQMVYINKAWLDTLGLDVPRTKEDFKTVLTAFLTKDPNGNGKADEIPLVGTTAIARGYIDIWLINNFQYLNNSYTYNMGEDGKIYSPFMTDEYREGIKYVNELYDAGLLSPLTWTIKERTEIQALINPANPADLAIGCWAGHATLNFSTDHPSLYNFTPLPPFEGSYAPLNPSKLTYSWYITEDCENPEDAFRLMMAFGEADAMRQQRYGTEGKDWHWEKDLITGEMGMVLDNADAFSKNTTTTYAINPNIILYSFDKTLDYGKKPIPPCFQATISPADKPASEMTWGEWRTNFINNPHCDAYWAANAATQPETVIYTLIYTEEEADERSQANTDIKSLAKQARAEFCTGVRDINSDADWNAYLKEMESMGINTLIKCAQSAYDRATKG